MSDAQTIRDRVTALREFPTSGESTRKEMDRTVELDQARTGRLSRMDAMQAQEMAKAGNSGSTSGSGRSTPP